CSTRRGSTTWYSTFGIRRGQRTSKYARLSSALGNRSSRISSEQRGGRQGLCSWEHRVSGTRGQAGPDEGISILRRARGLLAEQSAARAKVNPKAWNWERSHEIGYCYPVGAHR